ncbi:hypothetical protein EZJ49_00460 [Bdellovibrio bacteriovorus]|uniref:hypothetical protein n=1 Tax=Bdellovibrio bacteriovorus TaxID=959 RepID=UPI0021D30D4F|nr:hypothetical protein [Bdellovibrio bacteriovorus]UXR64726.1 hypothetical protein EZJ49_00460 [Bdellovibrio bacteriovorus]
MKASLAFILTLALSSSALAAWDLNDVSYLMPLPTRVGGDNLMGITTAGRGGPLLNPAFMGTIPPLTPVMNENDVAASLRVIAVRVDPCFPLPTPQSCQKQIRLVWQPIEPGFRGRVQTVDAALHSFYVLEDQEFSSLLTDLESWKKNHQIQTSGLPLQIHPAWAQQADKSPALLAFNEIVKKYAGLANLSRVTVMVVRGAGDMWSFSGFEVRNGQLKLIKIPRLDRSAQAFVNFAVPSDHFERGMISPAANGDDSFTKVIGNSDRLKVGSEDVLRKELKAIYRIEDPHSFNPENMDCASCHVAQPARVWLERNRTDLGIEMLAGSFAYKNAGYDLQNVSPDLKNTQIIRAFGYFMENPAISQRVIHESAEVADAINRYLKAR